MSKAEQRISRVMSLVLRHDPDSIGLNLDENGWAEVDELVACLQRDGKRVDRETIENLVAKSDKQRFRISDDGRLIRANQGHSIEIDLKVEERPPPEWLYYGAEAKSLVAIKRDGLLKGARKQVHLSLDKETAKKAGSRHGKPVILEVAARLMGRHGYRFYQADNGVWLTDHVPPDYLNQRFSS